MEPPAHFDPEQAGRFSLRRTAPSLLLDVILPVAAFNVLVGLHAPMLIALVAGGVFPALGVVVAYARSRQIEPLGVLVMVFLAIGAAASLISGDIFFAVVKDSMITAAFGVVCLASLLAPRPLPFYIVRQFVAGYDPAIIAWWDSLWQRADVRRMHRIIALVWGAAYILEAIVRVLLALVLAPRLVVTLSPFLAFGVTLFITIWTRRHLLAARRRRLALQAAGAAA